MSKKKKLLKQKKDIKRIEREQKKRQRVLKSKGLENKVSAQAEKSVNAKIQAQVIMPSVSGVALDGIKSIITDAKNYINQKASKKPKLQEAIKRAGADAEQMLELEINKMLNKYIPPLKNDEVRNTISKNFEKNYYNLVTGLEAYLYEFVSDGQGSLDHTAYGISAIKELIKAVTDSSVDLNDMKRLAELSNNATQGTLTTEVEE